MDVSPINILIGLTVMPPLIALLNQSRWPAPLKGIVAVVLCLVAAVIVEVIRGPIVLSEWRDTAMTVAVSAVIAYRQWWQPSGIAPAIESSTSARSGNAAPAAVQ